MATSSASQFGAFAERHIGTGSDAQAKMLEVLGYDSIFALLSAAVPDSIQLEDETSVLPPAATERETIAELRVHGRRRGHAAGSSGIEFCIKHLSR